MDKRGCVECGVVALGAFLLIFSTSLVSAFNGFGYYGGFGPTELLQNDWVVFTGLFLVIFALVYSSLIKVFSSSAADKAFPWKNVETTFKGPAIIISAVVAIFVASALTKQFLYGYLSDQILGWILLGVIVMLLLAALKALFKRGCFAVVSALMGIWVILHNIDPWDFLPQFVLNQAFDAVYEPISSWMTLWILLAALILCWLFKRKREGMPTPKIPVKPIMYILIPGAGFFFFDLPGLIGGVIIDVIWMFLSARSSAHARAAAAAQSSATGGSSSASIGDTHFHFPGGGGHPPPQPPPKPVPPKPVPPKPILPKPTKTRSDFVKISLKNASVPAKSMVNPKLSWNLKGSTPPYTIEWYVQGRKAYKKSSRWGQGVKTKSHKGPEIGVFGNPREVVPISAILKDSKGNHWNSNVLSVRIT